jgi:Ca2+-binding RTX toxin-like protein
VGGTTYTDSITVATVDGTTQVITVSILGTNDAPTITVHSGNLGDANDVVSEAMLAGGTQQGGGTTVASGTFMVADADGLDNIKSVTVGGLALAQDQNYAGLHGTLHIDSYDAATGVATYTYTLTSAIKTIAGVDTVINGETFALQVTDKSDATSTATIAIDVKDDAPLASTAPVNVAVSEGGKHIVGNDVVLIIDRSGSMAGTELTNLKASIKTMFDSGSVHSVFITSFSDTATFHNSGANGGWFTSMTDALNAVNSIKAGGSTDYDLALNTVTTNFTPPPAGGQQLVSIFISDGQPNLASNGSSPGIVGTEESDWYGFLQTKGFSNSYAVGFSGLTAANTSCLEPIAWHAPEAAATYTTGAADPNVTVVAQASDVANALLTMVSVTHTVTGNLLGGEIGADQPFSLVSVTVGTTLYSFNSLHTPITINTDVGSLTIKSTGEYSFTGISSVGAMGQSVSLDYVISDADGDQAKRSLILTVTDGVPTAVADSALATEGHWKAATNNSVDTISYVTVPGHWSAVTVTHPSISNADVNPIAGSGSSSAHSSNFAVVADANHPASVSVGITLSGMSSADTLSVGIFAAGTQTQVGSAQTLSANGTVTFAGIPSGNYYVQATGTEQFGNTDGNFKFKLASVDVAQYAYTPDAMGSSNITTPDVTWVAASKSTGNVLTNDLAGTNGGLHLTAVAFGSAASTPVSSTAGVDVIGAYGTLHIGSNGAYTYTPAAGDFKPGATDRFTYTVIDANNHSSTADLTVALNNYTYANASGSTLIAGTDGDDLHLTGTSGNEVIYGGWGNDTLSGGGGNDRLIGGAGDDHLVAGAGGSNVLIGGAGNDVMTGSAAGADVFKWALADQVAVGTPAIDHITNFNTASIPKGGDVLDLRDLLQGEHSAAAMEHGNAGSLDQYLNFEVLGGKLAMDVHDPADATHITQKIVLDNITGSDVADARLNLAHAVDSNFSGTSISDAELLKKLVDTGHLKTDV